MNHQPRQPNFDAIPDSIDRITPLGEPAPTTCPKCDGAMQLAQMDDSMVILCGDCKGVLIQSLVFQNLVADRRKKFIGADVTPAPLDQSQLNPRINCPGCKQKMEVHPYYGPGNVVIDSCWKCSFVFLDYGEFAAIENAPGKR